MGSNNIILLVFGLLMGMVMGVWFMMATQPPAEVKYVYRCSYAWMDKATAELKARNEEHEMGLKRKEQP